MRDSGALHLLSSACNFGPLVFKGGDFVLTASQAPRVAVKITASWARSSGQDGQGTVPMASPPGPCCFLSWTTAQTGPFLLSTLSSLSWAWDLDGAQKTFFEQNLIIPTRTGHGHVSTVSTSPCTVQICKASGAFWLNKMFSHRMGQSTPRVKLLRYQDLSGML